LAEQLFLSENRESFLDTAERLVHRVVQRMESSRSTFSGLSEPQLSNLMKELLGELVPAQAESHQNGHVDLTIWHPRGLGFNHITECKIWKGEAWHRKGMLQLLHYATGREGRTLCLAFFIKHKNMVTLLQKLRVALDSGGEPPPIRPSEDHLILAGAFVSWHEHRSGAELGVVHLGCHLWLESAKVPKGPADGTS
jgi:hypothetical protein